MSCLFLFAMAFVTPSRGAAAHSPGVTWLIFVDDLHLDFRDTGYIRTLLRSIASQLIREEDAFVLRSSGPSCGAIESAMRRSLLDAAVSRVTGNALPPAAILRSSSADDELQYRVSLALSAAIAMMNGASSLPWRRAAMLYVSNGYALDLRDERVAAFTSAAQRFQIPVFAMNGLGLSAARPVQGDAARAAMLNSLREISEPTGGIAILDEPGFVDALDRGMIDRWVR